MSYCTFQPRAEGGYQCSVCGWYSLVNHEHECAGQPVAALHSSPTKPCNCGGKVITHVPEIERMTQAERDARREAFLERQRQRKIK